MDGWLKGLEKSSGPRLTVCYLSQCGESIDASPRGCLLLLGDGFAVATSVISNAPPELGKGRPSWRFRHDRPWRVPLLSRFVGWAT